MSKLQIDNFKTELADVSRVLIPGGGKLTSLMDATHRRDQWGPIGKGSCGYSNVVLDGDGKAWCWGSNLYGQLGQNNMGTNYNSPVSVFGNHTFAGVYGGHYKNMGIKENGELWIWGYNGSGILGDNSYPGKSQEMTPISVHGGHIFAKAVAGLTNAMALDTNGHCWCWGRNGYGQLGQNNYSVFEENDKYTPTSVIGGHIFVDIAIGTCTSYGLKEDGSCWAWGSNENQNLGLGITDAKVMTPMIVSGGHSFVTINGGNGNDAVVAIKENGEFWGWGYNINGVLGLGDNLSRTVPTLMNHVDIHLFVQADLGYNFGIGLKDDGSTWCWGSNLYGQLGNGVTIGTGSTNSPVSVLGNHSFVQIKAGAVTCCAAKTNGEVWSWGMGTAGGLGNGFDLNSNVPVQVVKTFPVKV